MHCATAKVTLHLHGAFSLKDKRRIVQSVVSRLRTRAQISSAEVDVNDSWKSAEIGIAIVSGERRHVEQLMQTAIELVESAAIEAEVVNAETDVWSFDDA